MPDTSRIKSKEVSPKVMELKEKIKDPSYLSNAIERIAVVMSRHIVDSGVIAGHGTDLFVH